MSASVYTEARAGAVQFCADTTESGIHFAVVYIGDHARLQGTDPAQLREIAAAVTAAADALEQLQSGGAS